MKPFKRRVKFFFAIVFIAAIIFLNSKNYLGVFKDDISYLLYYPEVVVSKVAFSARDFFQSIAEIRKIRENNVFLTEENNKLRKQISDLNEISNENRLLRNALNLPFFKEHSFVDGTVIGKDPYNFSNSLIINRGSEDKVELKMRVVDSNGFYIGEISKVNPFSAEIRLIIDNQSIVSGVDQNTRVQGLIKSDRNSGLYFDMVSQDDKIETGDIITNAPSGSGAVVFPAARVFSVEKYSNKPFQKIKLLPLADMKKIEKVFVLLETILQ